MKKLISLALALLLIVGCLAGCGSKEAEAESASASFHYISRVDRCGPVLKKRLHTHVLRMRNRP